MIKKNVVSATKMLVTAHNGRGQIDFVRAFAAGDFITDLSFIDYVELPPGTSIGVHEHADNEEIYFIVQGSGTMTTNGERFRVTAGDLIVNKPGWCHGLDNDSNSTLNVLVWEVACPPSGVTTELGRRVSDSPPPARQRS